MMMVMMMLGDVMMEGKSTRKRASAIVTMKDATIDNRVQRKTKRMVEMTIIRMVTGREGKEFCRQRR